MINKNHSIDIRTCERIKFDQALYILTMYQKKIRTKLNKQQQPNNIFDADKQLQKIIYAWKSKWDADLTKPILNCVTSVYPRIVINQNYSGIHQQQKHYYQILNQFFNRLKLQHQDQTNFKIILQNPSKNQFHEYIQNVIRQTYNTLQSLNACLLQSIKDVAQDEQDMENQQKITMKIGIYQALKLLFPLFQNKKKNQQKFSSKKMIDQFQKQDQYSKTTKQHINSLRDFITDLVKIMDKVKNSQHGTTLFAVQPMIENLTYIVHPVLIAIQSLFKKQTLDKKKPQKQKNNQNFGQNNYKFCQTNSSVSKVVFINLDGYQSEYNYQFIQNFKKKLMYISFPKQKKIDSQENNLYSQRMYNKLMFNVTQNISKQMNRGNQYQPSNEIQSQNEINFDFLGKKQNPENYYQNVKRIYSDQKVVQQYNSNYTFIFPIRSKALKKNKRDIFQTKEDIQPYQSHFIRFILRDFLVNQIRQFNPAFVILSYSGRLQIQESHFVQIMQQITKVANYKIILFPNLTTKFVNHQQDDDIIYDGIINDSRIDYLDKNFNQQSMQCQQRTCLKPSLDLLSILARFLKVSSGTYNLTKSFEQESHLSKYKNLVALKYTDQIMTALGQQYPIVQRIRFRNNDLKILPQLYQERIQLLKKQFVTTVPRFYEELYEKIQEMLKDYTFSSFKSQNVVYQNQIKTLFEDLLQRSDYSVTQVDNTKQQLNNKYKQIIPQFLRLKENHFIQISGEKYSQYIYAYIRLKNTERINNQSKSSQISKTQSNFKGLYRFSYNYKDDGGRQTLKILDTTNILYKTEQLQLSKNRKYFPLLIMNHLKEKGTQFDDYIVFHSYATKQKGTDKQKDQTYIINENVDLYKRNKIKFIDPNQKQASIKLNTQSKFILKTEWSFTQTSQYIILFWPSQFDFVKACLYNMIKRTYEPKILNQIYMARNIPIQKSEKQFQFIKVNIQMIQDIAPRLGCSVYQKYNKLFIFGGFYQRQKNYLQKQHDIVTIDMNQVTNQGTVKMINQKQRLYDKIISNSQKLNKVNQRRSNSFVRPRIQYEFFELAELREQGFEQQIMENTQKTVIMFGGYGQNFLRPYSMLTYYYYEIIMDDNIQNIKSVNKRLIYDKAVPINVKKMTRNLGIIKITKKINTQKQTTWKDQFTTPDSLALCRSSYTLDKQGSFNYRIKYAFFQQEGKSFKTEVKKIFEQKADEFTSSSISISKIEGQKTIIMVKKDQKSSMVQAQYQLNPQIAKKYKINKIVKLTNQSIISSIIFWQQHLFMIIMHEVYTDGQFVIASFSSGNIQNNQEINSIILKQIMSFEENLSMHRLIVKNNKAIAIVHGERLFKCSNLKEYIIIQKKAKKEYIKYELECTDLLNGMANIKTQKNYSAIFENQGNIKCYNLYESKNEDCLYISSQQLALGTITSPNQKIRWQRKKKDFICVSLQKDGRSISLNKIKLKNVMKKNGDQQSLILQIIYNKKEWLCYVQLNKNDSINLVIGNIKLLKCQNDKNRQLDINKYIKSNDFIEKTCESYFDSGYEIQN